MSQVEVPSSVKFELFSDNNGVKRWNVEAIHVTTTRNNRVYPKEELQLGARSLSYRPININHDEKRWLPYNAFNPVAPGSNTTLEMSFDSSKNAVTGKLQISDPITNQHIESGDYAKLSIEQVPTHGEVCSCEEKCTCEQKGVTFTGIALLETFKGVQAGDDETKITRAESKAMEHTVMKAEEALLELLKHGEREPTTVQTVIFDKDKFTSQQAKTWLQGHDFHSAKVDDTENSYRFRQHDPGDFTNNSFRTISLASGIKAVIGRLKEAEGNGQGEPEAQHQGDCPDGHHMVDGKCVQMPMETPVEKKQECTCPMEKTFGKELADELKRAERFIKTGQL